MLLYKGINFVKSVYSLTASSSKFIQLLMSEDDLDSEERLLNASMSPNSEAEQSEASSSREEKVDPCTPSN